MASLTFRPLCPTMIDYEGRWIRGSVRILDLPNLRILFLIQSLSEMSYEDDKPCVAIHTCTSQCDCYVHVKPTDHPSLGKY
jgi:hypothetical protein